MGVNKTKEDFGYNEGLKTFWFQTHSDLPRGSFSILKRSNKYYWYFQLPSGFSSGTKTRMKYLCPTFDGLDNEGMNSFQKCLQVLQKRYSNNFEKITHESTKISTLIDEYIGIINREENSDEGRKIETTQSIKNGCNRFRDFCLMSDLRFTDLKNGKTLKSVIKKYLEYCKKRHLKRGTIRTYLKHIRGFLNWLSDEDVGKGIISSHPISSEFISKIYPTTRLERKGIGVRNVYYKDEYWDKMYQTCVQKVNELWNDFCRNGWTREHTNQPLGVGSDVVYFISLFQLYSGFRVSEILRSFRSMNFWKERNDKKNSSSYWNKRNGVWYLYIEDFKGTDSSVPVEVMIRSWDKPPHWKGKPTKTDKMGKPLYWDTPLVEVCMEMFRQSQFVFSSPNLKSHNDRHYGITYYMNLFKIRMVSRGVGGEGWERYGILSSHHLRSYFITYSINQGMSLENISQLTRHSPTTLWKYYLRHSEDGQLKRQREMDESRVIKSKSQVDKRDKN